MPSNKVDLQDLEKTLLDILSDSKLTVAEKDELREVASNLDIENLNFLRNRAFDVARQQILSQGGSQGSVKVLGWLEKIVKLIDQSQSKQKLVQGAYFSPGNTCRNKLMDLCHQARNTIDICVFTISDNKLSSAILKAAARGVKIRIITDNDKSGDLGSDVDYLREKGIPIVMDTSPYHMHHKFAMFDSEWLANGSFNWTRSATKNNEENIVVNNERELLAVFQEKFNELWKLYS